MRWPLLFLFPLAVFAAEPPADFFDTFNKLSVIVDSDDPGAMELAHGSLLATRFFSVGPPGLPKAQSWFDGAPTRGRASMAGLFLTLHGKDEHLEHVQRALETDVAKRRWIYELVGTPNNFNIAMANGETWKPFLRVLPSTDGCRKLSANCMKSSDALVRRTGVYWGYWFADKAYWTQARELATSDPDALTRRMADFLLRSETSRAGAR